MCILSCPLHRLAATPHLRKRFGQIDRDVKAIAYAHDMGADQHHDWRELAASALEWWRDAGVDVLVDEAPRDWLAKPAKAAANAPATAVAVPEPVPVALPDTLEAFLAWRVGSDVPEASWGTPLLAPEGPASAEVMVVVDCPEGDALLDGAPGQLFDRMLAAIGCDRASIHLASLAAARPLGGRIGREHEPALARLLAHHVALVAPKRLLVFGEAASCALIGMEKMRARGSLHVVNPNDVRVEAVASWSPRFLLDNPIRKADAWKDLQLLMRGLR
jgi:uracil-DNA glycosylase